MLPASTVMSKVNPLPVPPVVVTPVAVVYPVPPTWSEVPVTWPPVASTLSTLINNFWLGAAFPGEKTSPLISSTSPTLYAVPLFVPTVTEENKLFSYVTSNSASDIIISMGQISNVIELFKAGSSAGVFTALCYVLAAIILIICGLLDLY